MKALVYEKYTDNNDFESILQIKDIPEIPKQRIQKLRDENRSQTFVDNYSFIYQEEALKTLNKNRLNNYNIYPYQ